MDMNPLQSSSLTAYGYDEETQTLAITFVSGQTYNFRDVPKEKADGFAEAKSAGSYFRHEIRGHYESVKQVDDEEG